MLYTNLVGPLRPAAFCCVLFWLGLVPMWKQPIIDNLSQVAGTHKLCTLSQPDCVLHQKPVMGSELTRIRITHYYYYYYYNYICTSLIGDYNQIQLLSVQFNGN
jgi:hypothetical protein